MHLSLPKPAAAKVAKSKGKEKGPKTAVQGGGKKPANRATWDSDEDADYFVDTDEDSEVSFSWG